MAEKPCSSLLRAFLSDNSLTTPQRLLLRSLVLEQTALIPRSLTLWIYFSHLMWVRPEKLPEGHVDTVRQTLIQMLTHLAAYLHYPRLVAREVCLALATPFRITESIVPITFFAANAVLFYAGGISLSAIAASRSRSALRRTRTY